jgi:hypothetical protein
VTKFTSPPDDANTGKFAKLWDLFNTGLLESGLSETVTQAVIEDQGPTLVNDMIQAVRKRVETAGTVVVRHAKVYRRRGREEALNATGRNQYLNDVVVMTMPKGMHAEVDVVFFKPDLSESGGRISDVSLDKEYERRGLKPADPYSLAAVNETDPAFADDHPNGSHWKDRSGNWCFVTFDSWLDRRRVFVDYCDGVDWSGTWWFAGISERRLR